MDVTYLCPPWLSGGYHPRYDRPLPSHSEAEPEEEEKPTFVEFAQRAAQSGGAAFDPVRGKGIVVSVCLRVCVCLCVSVCLWMSVCVCVSVQTQPVCLCIIQSRVRLLVQPSV
jgi:hypothetical protein